MLILATNTWERKNEMYIYIFDFHFFHSSNYTHRSIHSVNSGFQLLSFILIESLFEYVRKCKMFATQKYILVLSNYNLKLSKDQISFVSQIKGIKYFPNIFFFFQVPTLLVKNRSNIKLENNKRQIHNKSKLLFSKDNYTCNAVNPIPVHVIMHLSKLFVISNGFLNRKGQ